ncbi:MAG: hypothetical protein Pars2KO_24490 [Parasphingorhabdus sp.]
MDKLIQEGKELAERKKIMVRSEVKSILARSLPDHIAVEEDGDDLLIKGPHLSEQLIDNVDLRDVAFLMRGVR